MKIKMRRDDASMLEMNDWISELRDNDHAEPIDDAHAEPAADTHAEPAAGARAEPAAARAEPADDAHDEAAAGAHAEPAAGAHAEPAGGAGAEPAGGAGAEPAGGAGAEPAGGARAEPAGDGGLDPGATAVPPPANRLAASAEVSAGVGASAGGEITEPAAIGDQLRIPIAWCEMGSCISHHVNRAALGEADIRARAILVGWRVDALGRLACPRCQQNGAGFRTSRPVALWDRDAAITRALLMTAALRAGVF